jgi:hypothetical protein
MPFAVDHWFRLAPRGGPGLVCDEYGLALGALELTRARLDERGARRYEVRSPGEIGRALRAAYGPQRDEVVQRLHRGLRRAAARIDAGELGLAGIEAVMLGVPDLTPDAVAKLDKLADIEKRGEAWRDQPRVPKLQPDGGQWTTDGAGAPSLDVASTGDAGADAPQRAPRLDDAVYRPGYRPGADHPFLIAAGAPPEETEEDPFDGSNGPPDEFTYLQDLFPGLKDRPGLTLPLAITDSLFVGSAAYGNQVNLDLTLAQYHSLIAEITAVEPKFVDNELWPAGGIAGLSQEGRANLINELRMQRALAFYRVRKDPGWLQVETVRFLSKAVDEGYAEANQIYSAGKLKPVPSLPVALGNEMDKYVRSRLKREFNTYGIVYGKNGYIMINNRDYDTSSTPKSYRQPDARIGDLSIDWTLESKTISSKQVLGFFAADSKPKGVVILRPSALGRDSSYIILRPSQASTRKMTYAPYL